MVPAENRLKKKEDFERAIRKGSFFSFGNVTMRIIENNLKNTRIGFLVGKKSINSAAKRNKAKRMMRQAFREHLGNIKPGFDIVVICKPGKGQDDKLEFSEEKAAAILRKAKLINI